MLDIGSPRTTMMQSAAPLARFMFFCSLNYQVGSEVAAAQSSEACVAARYLWSSVAYHIARESIQDDGEIEWLLAVGSKLEMPMCVVQLDVTRRAQKKRLRARSVDGSGRYGVDDHAFWDFDDRMRLAFDRLRTTTSIPWHVLDTTSAGVESVGRQVELHTGA